MLLLPLLLPESQNHLDFAQVLYVLLKRTVQIVQIVQTATVEEMDEETHEEVAQEEDALEVTPEEEAEASVQLAGEVDQGSDSEKETTVVLVENVAETDVAQEEVIPD